MTGEWHRFGIVPVVRQVRYRNEPSIQSALFQPMQRNSAAQKQPVAAACTDRNDRSIIGVLASDKLLQTVTSCFSSDPAFKVAKSTPSLHAPNLCVVDCTQSDQHLISPRANNTDIPVIAIVDTLDPETEKRLKPLGVSELITVAELNTPRLIFTARKLVNEALKIEQLKSENRSLTALNEVAKGLMDRMALTDLLQRIADTVISLTDCDASYISMLHESEAYIEMVASAGGFEQLKGFKHHPGEGIAGTAWQKNTLVYENDYVTSSSTMNQFSWIAEACAVPISIDGKVKGVIGITYKQKGSKLKSKLSLVEEFSQLASLAIENATLTQITETDLKRTETARQLSQSIYTSNCFETLFDQIAMALMDVFILKAMHVSQWDSNTQSLNCTHQWESTKTGIRPVSNKVIPPLSHTLSVKALQQKKITRLSKHDDHFTNELQKRRLDAGIGATIILPIVHDESPWGVIVMHRGTDQRDFALSNINLLDVLTNQISIAIHRHGLQEQIQHQAFHDSLTRLPNRFRFESIVKDLLDTPDYHEAGAALIFLDLDGFKKVNDTLGHAVGDELLKQVSNRLTQQLKHTDTLARMGGDEFAILLNSASSRENATQQAQQFIATLTNEFVVNGTRLSISASAGINFVSSKKASVQELLKNADIAMYQAKDEGKNRVHCFSDSLARQYQKRIQLELDLQAALSNDQFELHYQPQVSSVRGTVDGVEALIRWNHPTKGLISPAEFIPAAEEFGLISDIGNWVIKCACQQISRWIQETGHQLSVAVNISADHFQQQWFTGLIKQNLASSGLDPTLLHLEVTESVVMNDVSTIIETLNSLRTTGVKVSVDDFGTGYSSLQYLQDLPLDILKIDRAFILSLNTNAPKNSVASTIIYLAKSFGLQTVAEGVETPEQLDCIANLGCDWIQGYLYSKPVPLNELSDTIRNIEQHTVVLHKAG